MSTLSILGAGSWGTAIALHLARNHHRVLLWGHNPEHVAMMAKNGHNPQYLSAFPFPDTLIPEASLETCVAAADYVIVAVPSHGFTTLLSQLKKPKHGLAWLTKGLDPTTHRLLSECVGEHFGKDFPMAVISGPSFATEVAQGLPTAITLASNHDAFQHALQTCLHHESLRVYLSRDMVGVQLGGAIKNVLAIACGISDGLSLGANAKAALMTRGLAEMRRLGHALGAHDNTLTGLAGMGDLVLTCTDNQSRNRRFGLLLGQGVSPNDAETAVGQVVEGCYNAKQVCALAAQYNVDMPICEHVSHVLAGKITPQEAVQHLMKRAVREE